MVAERFRKYIPAFLTVIILLLYSHTCSYELLNYWDNEGYSYLNENPLAQSFSSENFKRVFSETFDRHYHPLTLISLGIDHKLFGNDLTGYRAINLLLFILISLSLYFLILKLTRNTGAAIFSSLFFALHPYNVESVLWLSERKNLLFMLFLLPALHQYINYCDTGKSKYLWLSAGLFLLSLLSKSQGLPFIGIVFIADWFRKRRFSVKLILEKISILAIAFIFLLLTIYFSDSGTFVRTHPDSAVDYLFAGTRNLFMYFVHSLIPWGMSPYHPYPDAEILAKIFWYYPILIAIVIYIIFRFFKRNSYVLFGLLFFLISVFPLIKIFPIPYGNYIFADRYLILPLAGIGLALWAAGDRLLAGFKKIQIFLSVVLFLFFSVSTYVYSSVWENNISFYSHLTEKHPQLKSGWGNRGRVYMEKGRYNEAISDFTEVIHLYPEYSNAYLNRGLAYAKTDKTSKAYNDFSLAIKYDSSSYKAYNNRALLLLQLNKLPEALNDISVTVKLFPEFPDGWVNKSLIEMRMQKAGASQNSLDRAISYGFSDMKIINMIIGGNKATLEKNEKVESDLN